MQSYPGIDPATVKDPKLREALFVIDRMLRQMAIEQARNNARLKSGNL